MKKLSFDIIYKAIALFIAIIGAVLMFIGTDSSIFSLFIIGFGITLTGATSFITKLK